MTVNIGPQGLPLQEVVNVQVNLSPLAAQMRNFGAMMCVGPTDVIDVNERIREYTSLTAVANDFGTLAPEYEAAALHFGQSPQPSIYYVGRFAQTASHATLRCGVMAPVCRLSTISPASRTAASMSCLTACHMPSPRSIWLAAPSPISMASRH